MRKMRVLLVDDEKPVQTILGFMIEQNGCMVVGVLDGRDALELLEKDKDSFDLIILDLVMPVIGGIGVLVELKKRDSHIPVIVVTSQRDEALAEHLTALGVREFLHKSELDELKNAINLLAKEVRLDQ